MRRNSSRTILLISLLFALLECSLASAAILTINQTDRGWCKLNGFCQTGNGNYAVGDSSATSGTFFDYNDIRNFFVFDLAGVTEPISSATLAIIVPSNAYFSNDASENYELHDVVTSIAALMADTGGVAAHTDLGTGVVYGSRTVTAADNGTVVEITLNPSAIAAMNSTHGLFGFGGSITTLDAVKNDETIFGGTSRTTGATQLRLTLVPEPSTLLLLGIAAISLLGYRKAKS